MIRGTKGDIYTKEIIRRILDEGCLDINPRPKYSEIGRASCRERV